MSDIKWISIATSIFDDEKMCAIESLPDGTNIEIVWLKILCLAGKCNENGFLMISKELPYTDEMLAKVFRMDLGTIQRSVEILQSMGMIETFNDIYMVSNWMKYQSNTQLQHIKEVNRLRQQRYRNNQKALIQKKDDEKRNATVTQQSNATCHDFCSICNMSYVDVYITVINYLNSKTNSNYKYTTKKNQTLIHARVEEGFNIDDFKTVIDKKTDEWLGTDMERYLRPETLFGTKFEGYLNQTIRSRSSSQLDAIDVGE